MTVALSKMDKVVLAIGFKPLPDPKSILESVRSIADINGNGAHNPEVAGSNPLLLM